MAALPAVCAAQPQYGFRDTALPPDQRISDLLSRMTMDEKIACLDTHCDIPRLGIKGTYYVEGLHGLGLGGPIWPGKQTVPTTQFPQARGLGQTWDPEMVRKAGAQESYEARYALQSGKWHDGGLILLTPNADLARDPRWGRSEESYGEDPYLVGTLAVSMVKGIQGDDAHYWRAASLMKHFFANSNENGRYGSSSNFDERLMREYYSVPFRMGIEQGHANAFMTAYNAWNGVPMAVQPILKNMVMKQWGFNGIICTDSGAFTNMVTRHKYYPSLEDAAVGAIHTGINQFMDNYKAPVEKAYQDKRITEAEIDENLRGVFRVWLKLGLLDNSAANPYSRIGCEDASCDHEDPWDKATARSLVRKVTDESIVLLKDENHALPLDSGKIKSIAVIGPDVAHVLSDFYGGTPPYAISPFMGIRRRAGQGVDVNYSSGRDMVATLALAKKSDVAIVIIGNDPTCGDGWEICPVPSDGKEAVDRRTLALAQEDLAKAVYAVNPHTVEVLIASFPFTVNWSQAHLPAILEMTHSSEEQGDALADVLFGDYNPGGKLTQTWPASEAQLPPMMDYDIRHGRTYMYLKSKPLYAFGHGLSYTTFAYSNLRLSAKTLPAGGEISGSVNITNTGSRAGDEVAQLYVSFPKSKIEQPIRELKGFERISIPAGETKTYNFVLKGRDLAYWNQQQQRFVVEETPVRIEIGSASDDIRLNQTVQVK